MHAHQEAHHRVADGHDFDDLHKGHYMEIRFRQSTASDLRLQQVVQAPLQEERQGRGHECPG